MFTFKSNKDGGFKLLDKHKREIIVCNEYGKLAVGRYPDLTQEEKDFIIDFYVNINGVDKEKIVSFLDFEEEDDLFCS
jgi:hypothetical protein